MRFLTRSEYPGDKDSLFDLHRSAFGGEAEGKLVNDLRQSGHTAISLVAEADGKIAGHVLFSKLSAPMRALALAPVAVHPDSQKHGIGSALIRCGLGIAQQEGWSAVFVLGDPYFYTRFGFNADAAKGYNGPYTGEHFMILPFASKNIPNTGRIVYPEAFARLA
jgi:putative acetyltransferase